jgi:hypothetical protein
MAINFPATGGQATDGTFTYTVAGIVYAWNGTSWAAAGAGASATDTSLFSVSQQSPAGTGNLSYASGSGSFTYTPPDISSFLSAETDTLATVTGRGNTTTQSIETTLGSFKCQIGTGNQGFYLYNGASTHASFHWSSSASGNYFRGNAGGNYPFIMNDFSYVSINPGTSGVNLSYGGSNKFSTTNAGATITGALTAGGLTYPTTNGTSGQVLTSDGAGSVTWSTPAGARTTAQVTVSLANEALSNTSFTTPKTYALLKVTTSHAAWVTLYSDTAARTNDASRAINVDPLPGSGVLSEVITTGNQIQLITPGTICFNSAGTGTTYAKIVNKSGSTSNITVTLTYVVLES